MNTTKNILGICGSASSNSSNLTILKSIASVGQSDFELTLIDDLSELPHFKTELTESNVPAKIVALRKAIETADGIIICTPEYVFSIPSGLKNALEWCVSTTVLTDKPTGLITASANGSKGHEELKLIMETLQSKLSDQTTLLIPGVKGKVKEGQVTDDQTKNVLEVFTQSFIKMIDSSHTEKSKIG
ncbi:MAG: NAD(P)H-dependent oxidoreductase [Reichenbachiella sp.]